MQVLQLIYSICVFLLLPTEPVTCDLKLAWLQHISDPRQVAITQLIVVCALPHCTWETMILVAIVNFVLYYVSTYGYCTSALDMPAMSAAKRVSLLSDNFMQLFKHCRHGA